MIVQARKIRIVCLASILIQNLHIADGDFAFNNVASRIKNAIANVYYGKDYPTTSSVKENVDVEAKLTDTILEAGYQPETHTVTTEDGYILTIFRIRGAPDSIPVYIQHGLLEGAPLWLISGKNKSLPYILADRGFDVWLGNIRGNTFSKKHKFLSTSDYKYWDFSWQELGVYDLPAVITYITTLKNDSLYYVGHSMAGTTFAVMAIERPEIAKNVKAMIALAPANYVYHMRSFIKWMAPYSQQILQLFNAVGSYEFFPHTKVFDLFAKHVCTSVILRNTFCSNILFLIGGFSPNQLDYSLLPKIWTYFPMGTSIKLFIHWLQQIQDNTFRKFDYGLEKNLKLYNTSKPPDYDLSKVQVPIAIFWSENDWLVGPEDVKRLYNQIPIKLGFFKIEDEKFNHFDFLWAEDGVKLLFLKVADLITDYNNRINN